MSYLYDPKLHLANAYFGRGIAHYKIHDFGNAVRDYDSVLMLEPKHSLAMENMALAFADSKRSDSAIFYYTKAIALLSPTEYNGAQERCYLGRGLMYSLRSQNDLAMADFNTALGLDPADRYASFHRADLYKSLGSYDEAIADFKAALTIPKLKAKACWRIAESYALMKDKKEAIEWLKRSAENGFNDFLTWENDPELISVRDDSEFIGIVRSHAANPKD